MATTVTARGQITIVDLNDAKQVQLILEPSLGTSQIYNTDTTKHIPDYTATGGANKITPKVFVTGSSTNYAESSKDRLVSGSAKWYLNDELIVSGANGMTIDANRVLTIASNIPSDQTMWRLKFECKYHDPVTGQDTTLEATCTIQKTSTAGATNILRVVKPNGGIFLTSNADSDELTAVPYLYAGSTQISLGTSARGRVKWFKLDISNGTWIEVTQDKVASGTQLYPYVDATGILHVTKNDILNIQSFKCQVTDTKGTDETTDDTTLEEIVTFEDKSDPYSLEVLSTTGDKIQNGSGSTQVFARVYQGETLVESEDTTAYASQKFLYKWYKYNSAGSRVDWVKENSETKRDNASNSVATDSTGKNYLLGNKITVYASDVVGRCTIWCEIEKK